MKNNSNKLLKELILLIAILVVFYILFQAFQNFEIIFGVIILSFGVLSIIWTLIARYSLSPKSNLRLFTNNFLACSISVISFFVIRLLSEIIYNKWFIYIEFFFIFVTFFFFVLASYYIYKIGSLFGFERESKNIKKILKKKK